MKTALMTLALLTVLVGSSEAGLSAWADRASSDDYATKAPAMLVRGAENVVVSPGELVVQTYRHTRSGKPVLGTLEGLGRGMQFLLDRAGRGVADVALFWAPSFNGWPPKTNFPSSEI